MRFLFFTDTHIRGTSPRNRKDNLYETLKLKFNEIGNMIKELDVDYIIHGGDLFDRPDISPAIVREFAIIIKGYEKPVYSVAGNHDLYGHNPNTVGRTMLGLLEGIDIIRLINHDQEVILEKDNIRVQLMGSPYKYDIDGNDFRDYYVVKKKKDVDCLINIVHGMLLNKHFIKGIQYTLIDDIVDTEADITLAGHYHNGFGIITKGDKYFVNPGSLVRVTNSLSDMDRVPKVVLIDVEKDIRIREIPLQTALPGFEVLDRANLSDSQDRYLKLHEFYKEIALRNEFRQLDLNAIINDIAKNNDLSQRIKDEAINRISKARESMALGDDE